MNKFSLIIPVYNTEDYISKCLDSCINQDIAENDYEIIVIDDGSTDDSLEIIKEYQQKISNIILLQKKNGGVSSARNYGIRESKGDYLIFIDSDDTIKENSLKSILFELEKRPNELLIMNSKLYKSGVFISSAYKFPEKLANKTLTGIELFKNNYLRGSVCGVVFERKFIIRNNLFFEEKIKIGEDSFFMTLSFLYSDNIDYFDLDFYKVNLREKSASRIWDYEKVKHLLQSLGVVQDFIKKNNLNNDQLNMLYIQAYSIISNAIYFYTYLNKLNKYFEIKRLIRNSGLYPIIANKYQLFKNKIKLLNFSLDLFILISFIKNAVKRLFNKNIVIENN